MRTDSEDQDLTRLLEAALAGNLEAREEFIEATYQYLHGVAGKILGSEPRGVTLQPTALVNEALMRLFSGQPLHAENHKHFLNIAARQMRRVLIDRARAHHSNKREGVKLSLDNAPQISLERSAELVALDDALTALAEVDAAAADVVEKKFFGGYTDEETAAILGVTVAKVRRDWTYAKAWLHDFMTGH